MRRPQPTKDVHLAIVRLVRNADSLICMQPGKYGGSIHADILAVALALRQLGLEVNE